MGFDDGYRPRSVAELKQRVAEQIAQLREAGEDIQPVVIEGRLLAKKFWGKAWNRYLASFSDHENRLPRGRSYLRHGAVCHLAIDGGDVEAKVLGEYLYQVHMRFEPLAPNKWERLKAASAGQLGSIIELLQGKLSDELMTAMADPDDGLFPQPAEIHYQCDCPDYADMCKHNAAVMYAIGTRLDAEPGLLFSLRGVQHEELVSMDAAADALVSGEGSRRSRRRKMSDVSSLFGLEDDDDSSTPSR